MGDIESLLPALTDHVMMTADGENEIFSGGFPVTKLHSGNIQQNRKSVYWNMFKDVPTVSEEIFELKLLGVDT